MKRKKPRPRCWPMSKEVGLKWYLHSIGLALRFSPVQYSVLSLCENCVAARCWCRVCKQLLSSNNRNRIRWAILSLSQYRICTDLFENFSMNRLKQDLLNYATFNPSLFSFPITWLWGSYRRVLGPPHQFTRKGNGIEEAMQRFFAVVLSVSGPPHL